MKLLKDIFLKTDICITHFSLGYLRMIYIILHKFTVIEY